MGQVTKDTDWFNKKIKEYHGDKVELLSDYNGSDKPIDIVYHCEEHGDTYKTLNAKNICKSYFSPCKMCQSKNKSNSAKGNKKDKSFYYNKLVDYCKSRNGEVIEDHWTKAKDVYHFKCENKSHPIFTSSADSLMNGEHWCPYCSGRAGDFQKEFKEIIENQDGKMLSNYIDATTPILVKCNKHNYIWDIKPSNIRKGRWCPICSMNFNEKGVYDFLTNNGCSFKIQYKFDDLYGNNKEYLKYDFAIFKNEELFYLVEVDDEEHRDNHSGTSKRQIERQEAQQRDKIKDNYCKENNINLYRMEVPFRNFERDKWTYDMYYNYVSEQLDFIIKQL